MVFFELLTLIISIAVLAKSSDIVVENAAKLARFFGVSQLAVGLLLIAVSTSLPELSVSIASSFSGEGAIAAGNVFGSNIANILLVLGLGAFLVGFRVARENLEDIALALLLTTVISAYIIFHSSVAGNGLGFAEGAILLFIGAWYAFHLLSRKKIIDDGSRGEMPSRHAGLLAFLFFSAGIVVVMVSARFVVDSAVQLASMLGLAQSFIGATLIAIGTSLPELSIDLQALRKRHFGLALGDAIGSNMANLTLVLGTAAVISPIWVQLGVFIAALLFAVVANVVFLYFAAVKKKFGRREGALMLSLYVAYLIIIFFLQLREVALAA